MMPDVATRRRNICLVAAVCLLALAGLVFARDHDPVVTDDWRTWPVIPEWARLGAPVIAAPGIAEMAGSQAQDSTSCPPALEFPVTSGNLAVHFDSASMTTWMFAGDYAHDRIVRYHVDTALSVTVDSLPVEYGVCWEAEDLDRDGQIELVVQRGDPGFGGNGYLDILSAPNWGLRNRFTFNGMKVEMNAAVANIDGDQQLELYLTPSGLDYTARAVIIKYISESGLFTVVSDIAAPAGTVGRSAIADFDRDGRPEFITGGLEGYGLFEWRDGGLIYVNQVGGPPTGNDYRAAAVSPKPGGVAFALLGHSSPGGEFRYDLIAPTGDNAFVVQYTFTQYTGYTGTPPCLGGDVDCDGLDELVMNFYPQYQMWEWNDTIDAFVQGCAWNSSEYGSLSRWYVADFDRDGVVELSAVNHLRVFHLFSVAGCVGCDSTGRCTPPLPSCYCACHSDPVCDGIVSDVRDVVAVIAAAFRDSPPEPDPAPHCPCIRTDVNCTSVTDVVDVVAAIDVAFRGVSPSLRYSDPCQSEMTP